MSHLPVSHRLSEESSAASSDTYIALKSLLLEKDDDEPYQKTQGCRWSRWCTVAAWIAQLLLFAASVAFFCLGAGKRHLSDQQCAEQLSAYCESPVSSALRPVLPHADSSAAPAIGVVDYEVVRFQGALLDENPWKGRPSPELDEAWNTIVNSKPVPCKKRNETMSMTSSGPDKRQRR